MEELFLNQERQAKEIAMLCTRLLDKQAMPPPPAPKQSQSHLMMQQNFCVSPREADLAVRSNRVYETPFCTPIQHLAKSREDTSLWNSYPRDHSDSEDDHGKPSKLFIIQNPMIELFNHESRNTWKLWRTPNWESSVLIVTGHYGIYMKRKWGLSC